MNATEVVKNFMDAVSAGDIDAAANLLADDFSFSGTAFATKPSPTHGLPGIFSALGIKPPSGG